MTASINAELYHLTSIQKTGGILVRITELKETADMAQSILLPRKLSSRKQCSNFTYKITNETETRNQDSGPSVQYMK